MVAIRTSFPWRGFRTLVRVGQTARWPGLMLILRHRLASLLQSRSQMTSNILLRGRNRNGNPQPPVLFQMAAGYWLSQGIYVAAKLGVADLLKDGPMPCGQLAAATGTDERSLYRLLRALSSAGIFVSLKNDRFALTNLGKSLQKDIPGSLRAMVITLGETHYQAWGGLLHSIRTGSSAFQDVFGAGLFDYLQRNAEAADAFNEGMADIASMVAYAVGMAYDFSGISSIVDVGGGRGAFLRTLLKLNPHLHGTVFDLKSAHGEPDLEASGARSDERCSVLVGDFFESVPQGADAYTLCNIIHDWDDDHSVRILRNCRRAMSKNGRLLLVEMVVPDDDANCFSKLLDVNMLVMTGGAERTEGEFNKLLDTAGFKLTRIVRTMGPPSVIEAVPKVQGSERE